jgi:hypothetical protein
MTLKIPWVGPTFNKSLQVRHELRVVLGCSLSRTRVPVVGCICATTQKVQMPKAQLDLGKAGRSAWDLIASFETKKELREGSEMTASSLRSRSARKRVVESPVRAGGRRLNPAVGDTSGLRGTKTTVPSTANRDVPAQDREAWALVPDGPADV